MMKRYRSHRSMAGDVTALADQEFGKLAEQRAKRTHQGHIKVEKLDRIEALRAELDVCRKMQEIAALSPPHLHMGAHLWQHPLECGYWPFDSD